MPPDGLIIGVDLAPIKPIPRVTTFQNDITTDKCRTTIRHYLKTWKVDVVLHDGAPNVGTAWVQDAFTQAELALQALKLAAEFLVLGGTFVSKVFRSKDYNALLWVFKQLFDTVEATKPPSSRTVSAEIFVVCKGFKASRNIDPRFLDPRSVFAELAAPTPNHEAKVFNPEKKKRKREGYDEGDYTQFKDASASQFIRTDDPISMLGTLNRLNFDSREGEDVVLAALERLPETTSEIRSCCDDMKVLGRKEFRMLLRWRIKVREILGFQSTKPLYDDKSTEVAEVSPMLEDEPTADQLQQHIKLGYAREKKDRRKANQRKQQQIVRMQLNMLPPTEIGLEQAGPNGEGSLFTLSSLDRPMPPLMSRVDAGLIETGRSESSDLDDLGEESEQAAEVLDDQLDSLYEQYREKKATSVANHQSAQTFEGVDENSEHELPNENDESDDDGVDQDIRTANRLEIHGPPQSSVDPNGLSKRASSFFSQDLFMEIDGLDGDKETVKSPEANGEDIQRVKRIHTEANARAEPGARKESPRKDEKDSQDGKSPNSVDYMSSSDYDEAETTSKKVPKHDDGNSQDIGELS